MTFRTSLGLILAFITLPLLVVLVASVSPTARIVFEPSLWTTKWYGALMSGRWIDPFLLSVELALIVTVLSGLFRAARRFCGRLREVPGPCRNHVLPVIPLSVPQIVKGVAIVLFLSSTGFYTLLGTPGLIMAHVILTLPFVVRMIAGAMFNVDKRLDLAARVLGANRLQRIRYILLPLIKPGLFSGMTFAFILSFNNIPLSVFLVRPGETTLPITVINHLEYSLDPVLAAVNVASLLFILAAVFLFERIGGFSTQIHGGSK